MVRPRRRLGPHRNIRIYGNVSKIRVQATCCYLPIHTYVTYVRTYVRTCIVMCVQIIVVYAYNAGSYIRLDILIVPICTIIHHIYLRVYSTYVERLRRSPARYVELGTLMYDCCWREACLAMAGITVVSAYVALYTFTCPCPCPCSVGTYYVLHTYAHIDM